MYRVKRLFFLTLCFFLFFSVTSFALADETKNPVVLDSSEVNKSEGNGFNFKKIEADNLIKKSEETGHTLLQITQAFAWPLLMISVVAAIVFLIIGAIFASKALRRAAGFTLFAGILVVVLANFAPDIVHNILLFIQSLFQ